jgi:hypothetical protein
VKKQHDSRWIHRSSFNWKTAAKRNDSQTIQGQVFQTLQQLIAMRKALPLLHSSVEETYPNPNNPHVFITKRTKGKQVFIGVFNFSDSPQYIESNHVFSDLSAKRLKDEFQQRTVQLDAPSMVLGPYEYYWLTSQ